MRSTGYREPDRHSRKSLVLKILTSKLFDIKILQTLFVGPAPSKPLKRIGGGGYPYFSASERAIPRSPRRRPNFILRSESTAMKTINLKSDMPLIREALQRLDRELALGTSGEDDAAETGARLRLNRRRRRHSHRRAKAFVGDDTERSDSRMHLWRELVEIRRHGVEASAIAPQSQERLRSRPPQSGNHNRFAVAGRAQVAVQDLGPVISKQLLKKPPCPAAEPPWPRAASRAAKARSQKPTGKTKSATEPSSTNLYACWAIESYARKSNAVIPAM